MKKKDLELGMGRKITRRDLIQGTGLASLGLAMPMGTAAALERTCTLAAEDIQHAKMNCEVESSFGKRLIIRRNRPGRLVTGGGLMPM